MRTLFRTLLPAALALAMFPVEGGAVTGKKSKVRRGKKRPPLTMIGIDAGEWRAINYMRKHGMMPTLDRWVKEGAFGKLESIHPMFTPIVWTTTVTGQSPRKHNIQGFKALNPKTGHKVPVNRTMRRSPAVWNILSDKGLRSLITAIYATWPAEKIRGTMISDYTWPLKNVKKAQHFLKTQGLKLKEQTWPRFLYHKLKKFFINKFKPNPAFRKRFDVAVEDAPYTLKHSYGKDLTYFRMYRHMRRKSRYDFTALYLQGPDLLSHSFFKEFDAFMEGRLKKGTPAYKKASFVVKYYKLVDQLLGVYDKKIRRKNETVMVVSDHGFEDKGSAVLTKVSDDKFGKRRYWHRKHGILIGHGPLVRDTRIKGATVFDVTPTILAHFGIPVAKDMQGRALKPLIGVPEDKKLQKVASYQPLAKRKGPIRESKYDKAIVERLNDLGYLQ